MSSRLNNVTVEMPEGISGKKEPEMDHRDEFSKWMGTVEEARTGVTLVFDQPGLGDHNGCGGCSNWDCEQCFPEVTPSNDNGSDIRSVGMEDGSSGGTGAGAVAMAPSAYVGEDDMDIAGSTPTAKGRDGRGMQLGKIVQKFVPSDADKSDSPLTYGHDNLGEEEVDYTNLPDTQGNDAYGKAGRYSQDNFGYQEEENPQSLGFDDMEEPDYDADPMAQRQAMADMESLDPEDAEEMISSIMYMQQIGLSKSSDTYMEDDLSNPSVNAGKLKEIYKEVMGQEYSVRTLPEEWDQIPVVEKVNPSTNKGLVMENIDKDVAAMLSSLKKYDMLKESVAPVLMAGAKMTEAKPDFLDMDKDGNKKESMKKAIADNKDSKNESMKAGSSDSHKMPDGSMMPGKSHKMEANKEEVQESADADADVISWMKRFASLGNMAGYGR
jgi:hypothetical protein